MKPKNIKYLIDEVQSAAAGYCYLAGDNNFKITLSVSAKDGWVKVEEQQ